MDSILDRSKLKAENRTYSGIFQQLSCSQNDINFDRSYRVGAQVSYIGSRKYIPSLPVDQ